MLRLTVLALAVLAVPTAAQPASVVLADVPTYSAGMGRTDGPFTLLSLDGTVVVTPDATARADSASGAWDIGVRGTEVILNGGASGPGGRRGWLLPFSVEPGAGFVGPTGALPMDGQGECPRGPARVVCHGSGDGWYEYAANGVRPLGRTLVVERPDGTRWQVRFLDYRLGEPLASGVRPRYVTLETAPLAAGRP